VTEKSLELLFDYIVEQRTTIENFNLDVATFLTQGIPKHPEQPDNLFL